MWTGVLPSYATATCWVRFRSIHRPVSPLAFAGGAGMSTLEGRSRLLWMY
jgi:hypothetical protein